MIKQTKYFDSHIPLCPCDTARQVGGLMADYFTPQRLEDSKKELVFPQSVYKNIAVLRRCLFFTLFFLSISNSQVLTFPGEDITFTIDTIHFTVEGNYLFRNNSNNLRQRDILYPFPSETEFGEVDSVCVLDLSTQRKIGYETGGDYIIFNSTTPPLDSSLIHIYYRQKINSDSVKYILTTTSLWRKPFESAEYKLIVDQAIEITEFSYYPDKEYLIDGKKIYYWKKENFMPDKDMVFHFSKR